MKTILPLLFIFTITGCIKTAEQVQRERRLENISEQMKDSQGLVADLLAQIKDMQSQLDKMNGRIEELEHKQRLLDPQQITRMDENINLMKTQQQSEAAQLQQIQNELKEQRAFIEKVTASLASGKSAPKAQKKNPKTELNDALELVTKNKFSEARTELELLVDHPELSAGDHNKVFHGLGRVEFYSKNYDKAMVYFSKIFSRYPKASLAPSSLFFIGKSLAALGKSAESKEAFQKLIDDYPASQEAASAKKEL